MATATHVEEWLLSFNRLSSENFQPNVIGTYKFIDNLTKFEDEIESVPVGHLVKIRDIHVVLVAAGLNVSAYISNVSGQCDENLFNFEMPSPIDWIGGFESDSDYLSIHMLSRSSQLYTVHLSIQNNIKMTFTPESIAVTNLSDILGDSSEVSFTAPIAAVSAEIIVVVSPNHGANVLQTSLPMEINSMGTTTMNLSNFLERTPRVKSQLGDRSLLSNVKALFKGSTASDDDSNSICAIRALPQINDRTNTPLASIDRKGTLKIWSPLSSLSGSSKSCIASMSLPSAVSSTFSPSLSLGGQDSILIVAADHAIILLDISKPSNPSLICEVTPPAFVHRAATCSVDSEAHFLWAYFPFPTPYCIKFPLKEGLSSTNGSLAPANWTSFAVSINSRRPTLKFAEASLTIEHFWDLFSNTGKYIPSVDTLVADGYHPISAAVSRRVSVPETVRFEEFIIDFFVRRILIPHRFPVSVVRETFAMQKEKLMSVTAEDPIRNGIEESLVCLLRGFATAARETQSRLGVSLAATTEGSTLRRGRAALEACLNFMDTLESNTDAYVASPIHMHFTDLPDTTYKRLPCLTYLSGLTILRPIVSIQESLAVHYTPEGCSIHAGAWRDAVCVARKALVEGTMLGRYAIDMAVALARHHSESLVHAFKVLLAGAVTMTHPHAREQPGARNILTNEKVSRLFILGGNSQVTMSSAVLSSAANPSTAPVAETLLRLKQMILDALVRTHANPNQALKVPPELVRTTEALSASLEHELSVDFPSAVEAVSHLLNTWMHDPIANHSKNGLSVELVQAASLSSLDSLPPLSLVSRLRAASLSAVARGVFCLSQSSILVGTTLGDEAARSNAAFSRTFQVLERSFPVAWAFTNALAAPVSPRIDYSVSELWISTLAPRLNLVDQISPDCVYHPLLLAVACNPPPTSLKDAPMPPAFWARPLRTAVSIASAPRSFLANFETTQNNSEKTSLSVMRGIMHLLASSQLRPLSSPSSFSRASPPWLQELESASVVSPFASACLEGLPASWKQLLKAAEGDTRVVSWLQKVGFWLWIALVMDAPNCEPSVRKEEIAPACARVLSLAAALFDANVLPVSASPLGHQQDVNSPQHAFSSALWFAAGEQCAAQGEIGSALECLRRVRSLEDQKRFAVALWQRTLELDQSLELVNVLEHLPAPVASHLVSHAARIALSTPILSDENEKAFHWTFTTLLATAPDRACIFASLCAASAESASRSIAAGAIGATIGATNNALVSIVGGAHLLGEVAVAPGETELLSRSLASALVPSVSLPDVSSMSTVDMCLAHLQVAIMQRSQSAQLAFSLLPSSTETLPLPLIFLGVPLQLPTALHIVTSPISINDVEFHAHEQALQNMPPPPRIISRRLVHFLECIASSRLKLTESPLPPVHVPLAALVLAQPARLAACLSSRLLMVDNAVSLLDCAGISRWQAGIRVFVRRLVSLQVKSELDSPSSPYHNIPLSSRLTVSPSSQEFMEAEAYSEDNFSTSSLITSSPSILMSLLNRSPFLESLWTNCRRASRVACSWASNPDTGTAEMSVSIPPLTNTVSLDSWGAMDAKIVCEILSLCPDFQPLPSYLLSECLPADSTPGTVSLSRANPNVSDIGLVMQALVDNLRIEEAINLLEVYLKRMPGISRLLMNPGEIRNALRIPKGVIIRLIEISSSAVKTSMNQRDVEQAKVLWERLMQCLKTFALWGEFSFTIAAVGDDIGNGVTNNYVDSF